MARDRSQRERQQFLKLLELQERERMLLAYDIHDGFVQDVVGAQIGIDGMLDRLASTDPESVPPLLRVRNLVRKAIDDARRVVSELRPAAAEDSGLVDAVKSLVDEANALRHFKVIFTFPDQCPTLPLLIVATLTRIVQEALNNIHRHAESKTAEVCLTFKPNQLRLEIEDHGIGFDPKTVDPGRYGLEGIRERARVFGGKATIRSQRGKGTRISVVLPVKGTPKKRARGKPKQGK